MQDYEMPFEVLCSKFKPQHNKIVMLLQCYKLHTKHNDCMQGWMGRLRTKAAEYQYKEYNRLLTEQFINELYDNRMVNGILKEVATAEDTEDAKSEHILLWVCRTEAQRVWKLALNEMRNDQL